MDPLLTRRLHLRPDLSWLRVDCERGLLRAEGESHVVRGSLLVGLVEALNQGASDHSTLVGTLGRTEAEVYFGLSQLVERSLAFFDESVPPPGLATAGFRTHRFPPLHVDPSPSTPTSITAALQAALTAAQLFEIAQPQNSLALQEADKPAENPHTAPPDPTIRIALLEKPFGDETRSHLLRGPAVPVHIGSTKAYIGPWLSNRGPCGACYERTLRENAPADAWFAQRQSLPNPTVHPILLSNASTSVAWILAQGLGGAEPRLRDHLMVIDLRTGERTAHRLFAMPECPSCGDPSWMARSTSAPVVLTLRTGTPQAENGWRTRSPEETWSLLADRVSPYTGLVAQLGPVPGRDHPERPVWGCAWPLCPPEDQLLGQPFTRVASGKGQSAAQARLSALCEAIERKNGVFRGDEARVVGRGEDFDGAVSPNDLQMFSAHQFDQRAATNAKTQDWRQRVPAIYDPERPISWSPAWSLRDNTRRYLPFRWCYAYVPRNLDEDGADPTAQHDPNGQAAGSCIEEAILQGLLELIERDAVAMWWYHRLHRPALNWTSVADPAVARLREHWAGLGWRLWALDLQHDLEVPVYAVLGEDPKDGRFTVGFGAHLDPSIALWRALSEAAQLLDLRRLEAPPWTRAEIETQCGSSRFLDPNADFAEVPLPANAPYTSIDGAVRDLVNKLALKGLDTIVLNTSRPGIPLSTVKVAVPGLRHIWPRKGPGRLYDVPVRLGWTPYRDEAALNPRPLFL